MRTRTRLYPGCFYHIYNRGNNKEDIFREARNYRYFMELYGEYIYPIAETYAYCLLRNHFHFLVRIRENLRNRVPSEERGSLLEPSKQFASFFGTYTKAINKGYGRTGRLFADRFRRVLVDKDAYLTHLVVYIHRNPQIHGFVSDFRDWPYSSYQAIVSRQPARVERDIVLDWFGGRAAFVAAHGIEVDEALIREVLFDES